VTADPIKFSARATRAMSIFLFCLTSRAGRLQTTNIGWFRTETYKSAGSGGLLMANYLIFFLDNNVRISDPPEEVECVDDQVAIETAIPLLNGRAIEVWDGPRLTTGRTRSQRNADCSCLVQTGSLPKQTSPLALCAAV